MKWKTVPAQNEWLEGCWEEGKTFETGKGQQQAAGEETCAERNA